MPALDAGIHSLIGNALAGSAMDGRVKPDHDGLFGLRERFWTEILRLFHIPPSRRVVDIDQRFPEIAGEPWPEIGQRVGQRMLGRSAAAVEAARARRAAAPADQTIAADRRRPEPST